MPRFRSSVLDPAANSYPVLTRAWRFILPRWAVSAKGFWQIGSAQNPFAMLRKLVASASVAASAASGHCSSPASFPKPPGVPQKPEQDREKHAPKREGQSLSDGAKT